ncbi:YceI family protein [Flavobacterium capsici]|uniref:YceI family protein n=1 Tax=Flavobacterium capsici TaxID=3075618 RepID=A0AA96F2B8_9FLAO|nr:MULTISPECIES: YceI family protein [unclassified Flavobacterium]WNM18818.1 YceI family protein [Flavobacterium sp. PMR2A8]WNM22869.1 YceI family protein [Flavobacterium sp. PMTSA4]
MKKYLLLLFLNSCIISFGQTKLIAKNGSVTFEASVPAFEEVKAKNDAVTFVLNTSNGEIASLALMKGFRFKVALMEEHFNENYVESDKFPKATFKGKIEGFDYSKITSTAKEYNIKGAIEMHGKSKEINIKAKISKKDNGVQLQSNFNLNSDDFDIEIPSIVSSKVSKKVAVNLDVVLK